jgi:3-oxoacyl-[acyl-carrier-protein] synthase II
MKLSPVAITGIGVVSALGLNTDSTWQALRAGRQARTSVTLFSTEGLRCHHAATVDLPTAGPAERRLSRASRLAIRAASEAFRRAGLDAQAKAISMVLSTTGGAMEWGETFFRHVQAKKPGGLSLAARYQPQQQAIDVQRALGVDGPVAILGNACASGANALGHGCDLIRSGAADCVLAGGYEALTDLIFTGFDCLQLLTPGLCRPFDRSRDGILMGEGAAFLVLEQADHARARGAAVLGQILGYGHTIDTHRLTQPDPTGRALIAAMRTALDQAGVAPQDIRYVNAHGTGTPANDDAEAAAFASVFGPSLGGLAVSSTKAAFGHALGASGCLEAAMTLCAARDAWTPPQLNLADPVPQLAAALARAGHAVQPDTPLMSVNLGFGGSNAALILSR